MTVSQGTGCGGTWRCPEFSPCSSTPVSGGAPDLGAYEYGGGIALRVSAPSFSGSFLSVIPNPFGTMVRFQVAAGKSVALSIYDMAGRNIAAFESRECSWNAQNNPAGVYLIRAMVDGRLMNKRVLLVR